MKIKGASVVKGQGIGKKIGVPTINVDPEFGKGLAPGIYLCKASFKEGDFWGLVHFGPRPTFSDEIFSFEVYLLEYDSNLIVPRKLDFEVLDFIREVVTFQTPELMVAEIQNDISKARELIKKY